MATAAVGSKLAGNWGISVGQTSGAENIDFSPKSIDSGSKATFNFDTLELHEQRRQHLQVRPGHASDEDGLDSPSAGFAGTSP